MLVDCREEREQRVVPKSAIINQSIDSWMNEMR
jgi:hypothetical protein